MRLCGSALAAALAILATSCASSEPEVERATLGDLDYLVPAGWDNQDISERTTKIVVWSPRDNPRRESVAIMRTAPLPAVVQAGSPHIERLLEQAQSNLPGGKFGSSTRFRTKHGFVGVRIEGEFVPAGKALPYRRFHAVLIERDGATLVHVLYTASIADRRPFEIVLDNLNRKAG